MNSRIIIFLLIVLTSSLQCAQPAQKETAMEKMHAHASNVAKKVAEDSSAAIESIAKQIAGLKIDLNAKPVASKKKSWKKPRSRTATAAQPLALPVTPAPMPEPPTLDDAHGTDCDCAHCEEPITPKFAPLSGEILNREQYKQK